MTFICETKEYKTKQMQDKDLKPETFFYFF